MGVRVVFWGAGEGEELQMHPHGGADVQRVVKKPHHRWMKAGSGDGVGWGGMDSGGDGYVEAGARVRGCVSRQGSKVW